MHSLLPGTTEKWKRYWLPWEGKLLTCLFPAFSTSVESCEVWGWPREGCSRKGNSHFNKLFTDCPIPHSARDLSCCLPPHAPLFRPAPSTLSTLCCVFFLCRRQTLVQGLICDLSISLAAASWLAEREMLWCLPAVGVFLQGQKIPSCSPLLQPSPMGWDVWSWPLSSHLVNQNKLREFSVFSLLMPLNVYFFSQLYCKFWVMLDCAYIVGYLKLWDAELSLDCSF